MRELQQGGPKADGSMSVKAFWDEIYYPVRSRRWSINTRHQARYLWANYIEPAFGTKALKDITKASIELHFVKLADEGRGEGLVRAVLARLHSMFEEALDNDYIPKNPTRKVALPKCKPATETRSLGEAEVRRLWDTTEGRDYMIWRVLILTGARIGEVLALTRDDLLPEGLRIDESAEDGKPGPTKNRKTRVVPLPDALRAELVEWLTTHDSNLMFPSPKGKIQRRSDGIMMALLKRARTAANIPDLKFRTCRTSFATLFEGDIRDAQAMLGHHSPTFTLQIYRKPITERQQAAVNDLEKRLHVVPRRRAS
jgi:integrase